MISGFFNAVSAIGVFTHPGATQLTLPLGAILTISFFRERHRPYIIATHTSIWSASQFYIGRRTTRTTLRGGVCGISILAEFPSGGTNE